MKLGLVAALAIVLVGCSSTEGPPSTAAPAGTTSSSSFEVPTIPGVSPACAAAFAAAAAPALPSESVYTAIVNACPTVEEITAADKVLPDALDGQAIATFVEHYCEFYDEVKAAAICAGG